MERTIRKVKLSMGLRNTCRNAKKSMNNIIETQKTGVKLFKKKIVGK